MARLPPNPVGAASNSTFERDPLKPNSLPSDHLFHAFAAGIAVGCVLAMPSLLIGSYLAIHRKTRGSARAGTRSKSEFSADDVDSEARGLDPHMVNSKANAEVEGRNLVLEIGGESAEVFEVIFSLARIHGNRVLEEKHEWVLSPMNSSGVLSLGWQR